MKLRRHGWYVVVMLAAVCLAACGPRLTDAQHQLVDNWILCDECTNGERDSVRALGERAVRRLRSGLLTGPPIARLQIMTAKFQQQYVALSPTPTISQADYVEALRSNYIARYHQRSAVSLGDIGGKNARAALDAALSPTRVAQYRSDVLNMIRFVRTRMDATPFAGTVFPAVVALGDTVHITASAVAPFTGDERAALGDTPFTPDELLLSVGGGQLDFLAAGRMGTHAVIITNVGATSNSEFTSIAITSELDMTDRATFACTTLPCTVDASPRLTQARMPHTSVHSLRGATVGQDTLDSFRIDNTLGVQPLPITAVLSWSTTHGANVDLRWISCAPPYGNVGNTDGATQLNPESTSVTIPNGSCWTLLLLTPPTGNDLILARLRITTP
jgi:hypothetical protein